MNRKAQELEKRLRKNQFTLEDFLEQMGQIRKMGGIGKLLGMMPGMNSPGDAERKRGAERARLCPDGSDHPVYDAGRKGKPFHPQCQQKKADRSRIGSAGL